MRELAQADLLWHVGASTLRVAVGFAVGASLGALARWRLGLWLSTSTSVLPWGTLAANLIGGYLIGVCVAVFQALPQRPDIGEQQDGRDGVVLHHEAHRVPAVPGHELAAARVRLLGHLDHRAPPAGVPEGQAGPRRQVVRRFTA